MVRKRATTKRRRAVSIKRRRLVLRVTLRDIEPPIWRELSVPDSYTLLQLHRCLQLAFDWLDYHLFVFEAQGRQFARPGPDTFGEDAAKTRLADLSLRQGSAFLYTYDMGDDWEHDIVVRSSEPESDMNPDPCAYVLAGQRAAPPEDSGGPHGYERLLEALTQPDAKDNEDLVAWIGAAFDPEGFDLRIANHALVLASAWRVI